MFTGFHRLVHAAEERYRRRGYECGLDARDYQEAAEERFIEEDEDSSCGFNFGLGLKQTFEGERWEKKYENMNGWYMLIWLVVSTCSSTLIFIDSRGMRITDVWSIGAVMISGALGLWGSLLVAWRSTAALFWLALHVWRTLDAWSTNVIPMVPWALLKSLRYFNALCKTVIRSEKGCSYQQIFYVYICIFCIFSNLFIIIFHMFFLFVFL